MTTTPAVQHSRPDLVETVLTVLVGVTWSALPDHVASPSRRRAIRAALLAGGAGVVAVRSAGRPARDTPTVDDTVPDAAPGAADGGAAARPWGSIPPRWRPLAGVAGAAALVGGSVVSLRLSQRIDDACAARLARAGVPYPYTVVGLGWGAAALAMAVLDPTD